MCHILANIWNISTKFSVIDDVIGAFSFFVSFRFVFRFVSFRFVLKVWNETKISVRCEEFSCRFVSGFITKRNETIGTLFPSVQCTGLPVPFLSSTAFCFLSFSQSKLSVSVGFVEMWCLRCLSHFWLRGRMIIRTRIVTWPGIRDLLGKRAPQYLSYGYDSLWDLWGNRTINM